MKDVLQMHNSFLLFVFWKRLGNWNAGGTLRGCGATAWRTKRWGQWQRRNKDMSSEARGGEAFLCVLASQVPSTEGLWLPVGNFQLLIILKYIPQLQTLMSLDCCICYLSSAKNVITLGRRGRSLISWVLCVNQYGFDWSWVVAAKQVFCKRDWFHAMFELYLWIFSTIKEHATAQ